VKNRLDIGTFKRSIMAKYGKESEIFAHYFKKNRNKSWKRIKSFRKW
jgi:hypothetical protein